MTPAGVEAAPGYRGGGGGRFSIPFIGCAPVPEAAIGGGGGTW